MPKLKKHRMRRPQLNKSKDMSVIIQSRGEAGGGVAAHLQCPHCDHFSKSHAHQLTHMAASHPVHLDDVVVGRLGNILMYQNTARLFHCSDCFYTSRDFTKLYKHIISKHCMDDREGEGGVGEAEGDGSDGGEKEKMREEGEEEGGEDALKRKTGTEVEEGGEDDIDERGGGGEAGGDGSEGGEKEKMGEDKGGGDSVKRKRSNEAEEKEGDGNDDNGASQSSDLVKPDEEGNESVLMFDGAGYSCLICGWKSKLKALGVNHVMRKHDIPKAYATQAIKRDMVVAAAVAAAAPKRAQSGGTAEEDEVAGLSGELLKEEMEATAKVVRFISNRFVCLICGWKTKLKGFAISHVVRSHNVERPYSCKDCKRSFFLPSRLQQHVQAAHRPGRFACPFCCFRSHYLGGFRRHCSRCSAREEEEEGAAAMGGGRGGEVQGGPGGVEGVEGQGEEEGKEREMTRGERKRRKTGRMIEEDDEEEDDDDDE